MLNETRLWDRSGYSLPEGNVEPLDIPNFSFNFTSVKHQITFDEKSNSGYTEEECVKDLKGGFYSEEVFLNLVKEIQQLIRVASLNDQNAIINRLQNEPNLYGNFVDEVTSETYWEELGKRDE